MPQVAHGQPQGSREVLQRIIADDPQRSRPRRSCAQGRRAKAATRWSTGPALSDPETHTRYKVEIEPGATDEAHIIWTIEYWDIEKSRYPQFEHVAVIVAEDITSRFLNVISLFNRAIPLIAIQLRALEIGGLLTISATTVLDLVRLATAEER